MMQLLSTLLAWALGALAAFGYRIVFAATVLENLFIVGSFTPGDVITAGAAVAATTAEGSHLSPWLLIAVATVGSVIGANVSYFIGRRGGRGLIERAGPRFGIDEKAIEATEEYFVQHGSVTILLARFVAVIKNIAPAIAGASRMNLFWFELYTTIGAIGYSAALVGVGWFLGANFRVGLKYFGAVSWVGFAIVAVGVALWIAKRRHDRRLVARNAEEFEQGGDR
ncbi:MAG: DedA family protein [Coriobacteriia bacterium]|nr:DedA family protein [Coriobacteriia bacterium]